MDYGRAQMECDNSRCCLDIPLSCMQFVMGNINYWYYVQPCAPMGGIG